MQTSLTVVVVVDSVIVVIVDSFDSWLVVGGVVVMW